MSISLQTNTVWRHEHEAIKAVSEGIADEYQQHLAIKVIVQKLARTHDNAYIPGSFDQSAFLAGRISVGQKILKYIKAPVTKTPEGRDESTSD